MTDIASLVVRIGADIAGLNRGLTSADRQLKSFGTSLGNTVGRMGDKIGSLGSNMALLSAPIGAMGLAAISAGISFESAFADVRKTVNASETELMGLQATLRQMATDTNNPVSALDNALLTLTGVAAAAGQLGVETENIASFSETMSFLGVATNMTAEEAAVFAARFKNVTGMSFDKISNLADTLVTLGNNMATTESEIATFATHLAPLANFQWEPDMILGYSAALSSLGVSAELGGTNLMKSVSDMTTAVAMGGPELEGFAAIAGSTAAEFKKLAESDPELAFFNFIEGLSGMDASSQIMQLNELGITSVEQIGTLQRLAGGFDTLTQSLEISQGAWVGNGAALAEATAKADTAQGDLNRLSNQMFELGVSASASLLPVVKDLAAQLSPIIAGITDWVRQNPTLAGQILAVGVGATALGGAMVVLGPVFGALGAAVTFLISPLALLGAALTFADWGQIGVGFGEIANGIERIRNGDASGWDTVNQGIRNIGTGLMDIPINILNALMGGLESLTGLQLPEYNWDGIINGLRVVKDGWNLFWDNLLRGFDRFAIESRLAVNRWIADFRQDILTATQGIVDISPEIGSIVNADSARLGAIQFADVLTSEINSQIATGTGIDMSTLLSIDTDTFSFRGTFTQLARNLEADPYLFQQLKDGAGVGLRQALEDAIGQSMILGDEYTLSLLRPLAVELGVDIAQVESDVSGYIESIQPAVTISSAITVSPMLQNISGVIDTVRNALTSSPIAATVQAMISVSPILSGVTSAISAVVAAITGGGGDGEADGSHAAGLGYVPFDGYRAILHKGEAVIPASENRRRGEGGATVQNMFTVNSYGQSPQELVEWLKRLMGEGSY